jgi:hypothetical protein
MVKVVLDDEMVPWDMCKAFEDSLRVFVRRHKAAYRSKSKNPDCSSDVFPVVVRNDAGDILGLDSKFKKCECSVIGSDLEFFVG